MNLDMSSILSQLKFHKFKILLWHNYFVIWKLLGKSFWISKTSFNWTFWPFSGISYNEGIILLSSEFALPIFNIIPRTIKPSFLSDEAASAGVLYKVAFQLTIWSSASVAPPSTVCSDPSFAVLPQWIWNWRNLYSCSIGPPLTEERASGAPVTWNDDPVFSMYLKQLLS